MKIPELPSNRTVGARRETSVMPGEERKSFCKFTYCSRCLALAVYLPSYLSIPRVFKEALNEGDQAEIDTEIKQAEEAAIDAAIELDEQIEARRKSKKYK